MSNKNKYSSQINPDEVLERASEQPKEDLPKVEEVKAPETTVNEAVTPAPVTNPVTPEITKDVPQKTISTLDTTSADVKVAKLDAIIAKYVNTVSIKNPTDSTKVRFVEAFNTVADYVINSDSYAVYNKFYSFFLKEREGLTHRNVAMAGIHTLRDLQKKSKISAFYAIFYAITRYKVDRKHFGISIKAIRTALRNDKFCNWVQAKLNNQQ